MGHVVPCTGPMGHAHGTCTAMHWAHGTCTAMHWGPRDMYCHALGPMGHVLPCTGPYGTCTAMHWAHGTCTANALGPRDMYCHALGHAFMTMESKTLTSLGFVLNLFLPVLMIRSFSFSALISLKPCTIPHQHSGAPHRTWTTLTHHWPRLELPVRCRYQ